MARAVSADPLLPAGAALSNDGDPSTAVNRGELTTRAAKSFSWSAVSLGSNRLLVFVSTLVLARILTPHDFGVVAAAMTFILYLEVALDLGVGSALVYEQEAGITDRVQSAFTLNLLVSGALAIIGALAAPIVARFFNVSADAAIFRVLALYLLFRGLGQVSDALLRRDLLFRRRTLVDVARGVTRAGLSIALAVLGLGAWAIVWGFLAGEAVATAVAWMAVRFRPTWRLDRQSAGVLLRFGANVAAIDIMNELAFNSDYLVVANQLGATWLGFYTVAYKLPELLIVNVFWVFSDVAFPVYSRTRTAGTDALRRTMLKALTLTTLFGFAVGAGLAVVSRDAIVVLFSAKWRAAIPAMVVLSIAAGLSSVGFASGDIFPAVGRPGTLTWVNVPFTALRIAGFIVAAPHGIVAVAWVHLTVNLLYGGVRVVIANRFVGATSLDSARAFRPAALTAAGIVAVALPVRWLLAPGPGTLLLIIGAGCVGGAAGLALGGRESLRDIGRLATTIVKKERP
jgi:PST family polysaccharide transporter